MSTASDNPRMEDQNKSTARPEYKILHRVSCGHRNTLEMHAHHPNEALFLDPPRMFKGDTKDSPLRGKQELTDLEDFLEKRPEISFIVQRDYNCKESQDMITDASAFVRIVDMEVYSKMPSHVRPFLLLLTEDTTSATPTSEKIHRFSKSFVNAINRVQNLNSLGVELLHDWHSNNGLIAPYLLFYHTKALLEKFSKEFRGPDGQQVELLLQYLELKVGQEYREADTLFTSGFCTRKHFDKLFWRGQIVSKEEQGQITAFIVRSCSDANADTIILKCETWTFHGKLERELKTLKVSHPTGPGRVTISSLGVIPLQYDGTGLKERLIERGRFFWNCRNGGLVTSVAPRQGFEIKLVRGKPNEQLCRQGEQKLELTSFLLRQTNPRYMIDMATYNELHGEDQAAETRSKVGSRRDDLGIELMSKDEPPAGPFVLMLPPTIPAFRFHDKKWRKFPAISYMGTLAIDNHTFRNSIGGASATSGLGS